MGFPWKTAPFLVLEKAFSLLMYDSKHLLRFFIDHDFITMSGKSEADETFSARTGQLWARPPPVRAADTSFFS